MHEDCINLQESIKSATEAIKETNIVNSKLYKLIILIVVSNVIIMLLGVTCVMYRDYIQYTTVYEGVTQTQMTITGSNNLIEKGGVKNGNITETPEKSTKETAIDSEDN